MSTKAHCVALYWQYNIRNVRDHRVSRCIWYKSWQRLTSRPVTIKMFLLEIYVVPWASCVVKKGSAMVEGTIQPCVYAIYFWYVHKSAKYPRSKTNTVWRPLLSYWVKSMFKLKSFNIHVGVRVRDKANHSAQGKYKITWDFNLYKLDKRVTNSSPMCGCTTSNEAKFNLSKSRN